MHIGGGARRTQIFSMNKKRNASRRLPLRFVLIREKGL
jgi:hypothetical protein